MIATASQMHALPQSADVLIIGGGPVGMTAAISLRVHGVENILIVDENPQNNQSRATIIHAGTLVELETIGCANIVSDKGIPLRRGTIRTSHTELISIDLDAALSRRGLPVTLGLPQFRTEKILADRLEELGTHVVRPQKLVSLEDTSDGIIAHFESGQTVKAPYVIAADGARSTIRRSLNIQLRDPGWLKFHDHKEEKPDTWLAADVQFAEGEEPKFADPNGTVIYLDPEGFFVMIPLSESQYGEANGTPAWRIMCQIQNEAVLKDNIQHMMDTVMGRNAGRITNVLWSSVFKVRSAVADQFVKPLGGGTVILIGDAAHIHSPAGGQGINLGMRDAMELGPKLAQILSSQSSSGSSKDHQEILEMFGRERRERAIRVIRMTKVINVVCKKWTSLITGKMQSGFFWALGRLDFVKAKAALRLSGVNMGNMVKAVGEHKEKDGLIAGLMQGVFVFGMILVGIVYSILVDL